MKKRLLSVLLSSAMVLSMSSFAVCAEEGSQKIEKYDSLTTITSVRENPNPATQDYQEGEDAENNAWTRMLEEKYNIDVKYEWLAGDASDYTEKVNLMLASGELPDFFAVDANQFADLRDAELIQPLDEVWEMYANENAKNLIEVEGGENVLNSCTFDGKLMAIPFTGNPKEGVPLLYIRQDWLENLGLEAPTTMDEVIAVAEAFATQDPDQNGENDTYAVAMNSGVLSQEILPFFYANGAYPNSYVFDENGELTNSVTSDGAKEALQLLNKWYTNGYLDPEWFTKDSSKAMELLTNGKVGVYFGEFSSPLYPLQAQHTLEPESDWLVMGAPGYDGNLVKDIYGLGVSQYWVVSSECEHPEAMIKMLNEWVDLFYYNTDDAVQLEFMNSESGAEIWLNAPVKAYRGLKNMQCGLDITDYYNGNKTLEELTAEERGYVASIEAYKAGDETLWAWDKIFGVDAAATVIQDFIENDAMVFNEFWGNPTETMSTKGSIVDDYMLESYTAFINGKKSFDEWDNFVEEYKSLGYDEICAEVNEWYQSMQ